VVANLAAAAEESAAVDQQAVEGSRCVLARAEKKGWG